MQQYKARTTTPGIDMLPLLETVKKKNCQQRREHHYVHAREGNEVKLLNYTFGAMKIMRF
jgi:hypothetical protein